MAELIRQGRVVQTKPGAVPAYKRYLDEMPGVPLQDLWTDLNPIGAQAAERLGYPTQKPEPLLERIIRSSSNEGDIVLDPFCGCGTTIAAAEHLNRRWVGIDITHLAITLIKHRLHDAFRQELHPYEVLGTPQDLPSAQALALEDRYKFEWWALGLVDARPAEKKKGADTGVDGYIKFFDDNSGQSKQVIVQVKSGHVQASQIRDLKGVLQREKAAIGAFITLEEPTEPMRTEAVSAGFYEPRYFRGKQYPRIQILTIKELLNGAELQYPQQQVVTFKKAEHKGKDRTAKEKTLGL
jgi:site-specific DNA-methyltransferase (adenine-specific)